MTEAEFPNKESNHLESQKKKVKRGEINIGGFKVCLGTRIGSKREKIESRQN